MIKIELPDSVALVLFEILARNDKKDNALPESERLEALELIDAAEAYALWELHGILERRLPASTDCADYIDLVKSAKQSINWKWTGEPG